MDSDTKLWTGNGQRTGHEAAQNLPAGFKHILWIIVLVVFYGLDEEYPVLRQLSPGCN